MSAPGTPNVIKTNGGTVGCALRSAGIVYRAKASKENGREYLYPVEKIRVKGKTIRPTSEEFAFELLLNGEPTGLKEPIKNLDVITIRETRILFY